MDQRLAGLDPTCDRRIRLIEERRCDPPRPVVVEHGGEWWPGLQPAGQLCDDGRGLRADVEYSVRYDWGIGKHLRTVPPERLRLPWIRRKNANCPHR